MLPLKMLGLLMLFLLRDADSSCPSELNPLILDPVIGEYGSEAMVICSSTIWDKQGITLLVGNHTITDENGINSSTHVQLRDWNMKAECKIQLNNSIECVKEVEITAYKNPEVVLSIENKDETLYELQCDVTNFAPAQNLIVTWYRHDEVLATNYSAELTREAVNESFILVVNVNRSEKVVPFRCQAQLDLKTNTPLNPVISQTYNITALYAPQLSTNYSDFISISKGENVTLTCEVEGNPPPDFQWSVDGKIWPETTRQLKIIEVNDSATYTCTATNDWGNNSVEIYVHVTEVTTNATPVATSTVEAQTPQGCSLILTPPEIMVRFGGPVEINCSSNTDIKGIGWEASVGGRFSLNYTTITWKVEKLEEWGIKPTCFANLINRIQCEVVPNITLYQTPDVVSISAVDQGPMIEGKEYRLKCDINNVAPVQVKVKWYHGNQTVSTEDIQETYTTPTNVSTYYTVTPERGDNGSVFRCEAELLLGPKAPEFLPPVTSDPFTAVVYYKPLFKDFPTHYTAVEKNFTLRELPFQIDGNPEPVVNWYYEGKPIDPLQLLERADSGDYTAEAGNDYGTTNNSVFITVEYGPNLTCKEQYEVVVNSELKNPCKLDGSPQPSTTWFKHEKEMFSPQRWTKHDSGMYLLKATNTHGAVERKFNLQVLYAPEFADENTIIVIALGQNVTFNCSAKGNPNPEIHWIYDESDNLIETTGERYSIITITEATSANAGVYQCAAKNKVRTVTRLVTLVEKDKTTDGLHPGWILPVVILAGLLGLFILLVLLRNYKKKQGQYSFVANKDASHIPMITHSAEGNA